MTEKVELNSMIIENRLINSFNVNLVFGYAYHFLQVFRIA